MHPEAMKAQAIAAYSYIMFNGGSVNNVILKPNPPQNVIDAVSAVAGQALYYDGDYASDSLWRIQRRRNCQLR